MISKGEEGGIRTIMIDKIIPPAFDNHNALPNASSIN
jgi:hypothetical protein